MISDTLEYMIDLIIIYFCNCSQLLVLAALLGGVLINAIRLIRKKEGALRKLLNDLLKVTVISAISLLAVQFVYKNYSDYATLQNLVLNTEPLKEYECMSEEVEELTNKIKEDFGISVYVNLDPTEVHGKSDYEMTFEVTEEEALTQLRRIYSAVSIYNEDALKWMPDKFYIVSSLDSEGVYAGINSSRGYIFHSHDYIVLCGDAPEGTVHHEIMHSLDIYLNPSDLLYMIENSESGCSLVSEYACTNYYEFIAESWEYSFNDGDNEYHELMRSYYPRFLKGFGDETYTMKSDYEGGNEYNSLNESGKAFYQALDGITPGETITLSIDREEAIRAKNAFEMDHGDCLYYYSTSIVSNADTTVLTLDAINGEIALEETDTVNTIVLQDLDALANLNDYDQLLNIYRYVKSYWNAEETLNSFEEYAKENTNELLRYYLAKMGYASTLVKESGLPEAVIVKIEDNYYWLIVEGETEEKEYLYYFLIPDEMYEYADQYTTVGYDCLDSSLCYAAKKELYLEEFNTQKIDNYLVRVFRRSKDKQTGYILCKDDGIADQVIEYILKEDGDGYSRFARLWFNNISYNAPGFSYTMPNQGEKLVIISDFTY